MNKPIIRVDPDEEIDLVCRLLYYQTTGYHSNSRLLYRDLKKEGYQFPFKKVRDWLMNQNEWQKHAPSPKYIPRVSYGSSKWGLAPAKAIKLKRVESRSSTKYKRPVGKDEKKLKKGDTVRYLLANGEWEGGMENQKRATDPTFSPSIHKIRKIIVSKNEPILYYLE
ncbi:8552_t:CDS:2, partial [Entrophospora sp. SA101]